MKWVAKGEVKKKMKPIRKLNDQINKGNMGYKIITRLVGSSGRNLVLRHHNKGFDCDVDIIVTKKNSNLSYEKVRKDYIKRVKNVLSNRGYGGINDRGKSFSFEKKVSNKKEHGFDFIIMIERNNQYYAVRRDGSDGPMRESRGYKENEQVVKSRNLEENLKREFKKEKERLIDVDISSFSIYCNSLNTVTQPFKRCDLNY